MIDRKVTVLIGDTEYHLQPTLEAMLKINERHGSLRDCLSRIARVDVGAIFGVIEAGARMTDKQSKKMREDAVEGGMLRLLTASSEYIELLLDPTGEEGEVEPGEA